jgi:SAM-dependent methyltransferase
MLDVKTEDADYRDIEESYDEGSKDYSGQFQQPHEFIELDRQEFIRQLLSGSRVLDCGCGPGMDTERFSQLGYEVTSVDLSERFVQLTRARVPAATVEKMDMRFLNFPPKVSTASGLPSAFFIFGPVTSTRLFLLSSECCAQGDCFSLPSIGQQKRVG